MNMQLEREAAERLFAAWERWTSKRLALWWPRTQSTSGRNLDNASLDAPISSACTGTCLVLSDHVAKHPGRPSLWVAEGIVDYGERPVHLVGVVDMVEAKVIAARYYFAYPVDPPAERVRWASA